ncbi:arthropsin7 [Daphnia sinensis]|uniref:Arthropsin7 n=1 Tax=Daphnia sinensis TaxID=1820382 RepID=A0AAD5KJW9_9CRUS|nr:arthropsin7 [Daphnia sinensis]
MSFSINIFSLFTAFLASILYRKLIFKKRQEEIEETHMKIKRIPTLFLSMNFNGSQASVSQDLMERTLEKYVWRNAVDWINSSIDRRNDSLIPSFGDGDDSFWTKEQLILIENFPANAFIVMGLIVSVIGIVGLVANGMVLLIFSRFKRLRSPPANTFIINLALSDMSASALHSMAAYSNFNGRWAFGRLGCELYGMGIGFFGLVSILTFSAIAYERCLAIAGPATRSSVGLADGHWKVTRSQAQKVCGFIWLHCGMLVSLPFFGWSAYVPEGLLTSCSWDYTTRTASNRAYYILLLTTGFLLPLLLICASYGRIMASVMWHARQMVCINSKNSAFRKLRRQTEIRTAQIVVTLILVYLTAWTPYAVVTLIGQFGSEDSQLLSPMATAIPAYFAKTAVVLDPLVYGFSHPHFRNSLRHYLANFADHNKKSSSGVGHNRGGIELSLRQGNSKSWPGGRQNRSSCCSSYQSRGMTIYPTASAFCRTLHGVGGVDNKSTNQRRMLRTFRDLSVDSAVNFRNCAVPSISQVNNRGKAMSNGGDLEMCNNAVAVVSQIQDSGQINKACNADDSISKEVRRISASANRQLIQQSTSTAVNNFKRVHNAEFHGDCPADLPVEVIESQLDVGRK